MTGRSTDSYQWLHESIAFDNGAAADYLDICKLEGNGINTARKIVKNLLNGDPTDLTVTCDPAMDDLLFRLLINEKNQLNINGISNLGLGFPIVRFPGKKNQPGYLAPLFIWPLSIHQSEQHCQWKIKRDHNAGLNINYALHQYLLEEHKIDLLKLSHPITNQVNFSAIALSRICYELSSALGIKEDLFVDQIVPLQAKVEKHILCSGVLAFFSGTSNPVITNRPSGLPPDIRHPYALQTLDPAQQKIFQEFWQNDAIQVLDEPGLGKSHLIEHLLVNALSNGHNCLFLADSIKRIKKLRNALMAAGLDHLLLEITDPQNDIQKIRQALQYKSSTPKEQFEESAFQLLIQQCLRQKENLDLAFSHLEQPVFDKATWAEVIPHYLRSNQSVRQDLLDNQLSTKDFTFHPTEYRSLKEAVQASESLFRPINNLKHPLQQLNTDIFIEHKKDVAKAKVEKQLNYFIEQFEKLHHRYILKQQDYTRDLRHSYDVFFEDADFKIEQLRFFIEDNQMLYGSDFEDSGLIQKSKLKVYGVFSGKHKNILQAREQISEAYQDLRHFLQSNYPDFFQPPDNIDQKSSDKMLEHLNKLEDQLYKWQEVQKASVPETLQRLNAKTIHAGLDYSEQISELEYSLDIDIEALNEARLFQLPLQNRMLTIPMRQLFIQDILNQLHSTKNNLDQFELFYDWQRHWLLLPEVHRQLISAIIKVHPPNWVQAFESWYFYQRLRTDYHFKMPKSEKPLLAYKKNLQALQQLLPSQIRQYWRQQITKEKVGKHIHNLTLNELFNTQFQRLRKQFPIIALSPPVANQLQFTEHVSFDVALVFQTQSTASPINNYPASRVLHFLPGLPEERRLLQKSYRLQYFHKATSAAVFQFANHLIHNNNKHLVRPLETDNIFRVFTVDPSSDQRINPKEAEAVVQDLIRAGNDTGLKNKFTVVCLTVEQRDLIARKLYNYSRTLTSAEAEAFSDLLENRIGLFHVFETIDSDYDTLIFSLTKNDFDARESAVLPQLHSKKGLQKINRLISTPFEKIAIYHSLSNEKLNRYTQHKTKKSARLLARWIRYAIAAQENHLNKIQLIFADHKEEQANNPGFFSEVAKMLSPYIGKSRIELNANFKGIEIPLLVRRSSEKGSDIALISEYCLHPEALQAHDWKIDQANHLKSLGLVVLSIWTSNWLEHPAMSARRLASAILKLEKSQD